MNTQEIMTQAVGIYFSMRQILSPESLNKQIRELKEQLMDRLSLTEEEYNTEWNKAIKTYHNK